MDSDTTIQRVNGLEFSRLDEAYLAIDSEAGYCYGLKPPGASGTGSTRRSPSANFAPDWAGTMTPTRKACGAMSLHFYPACAKPD